MTRGVRRLAKLQAAVEAWGGELRFVDALPKADRGFSEAPFAWTSLGVNFDKKIIYAAGAFPIGGLIHEAGHVFASIFPPNLDLTCETKFLGWEFLLARKVDLLPEWLESMDAYTLSGHDFGRMSLDEQSDIIEQYVEVSRERGLVIGEEPISVRV